jgi:hypothetical protein
VRKTGLAEWNVRALELIQGRSAYQLKTGGISMFARIMTVEGKLMMTDKDGTNEHTHMIPDTAKITLDGKPAKLFDLKKNDMVVVTVDGGGKVSSVAATHTK